jgi:hypothetical protein
VSQGFSPWLFWAATCNPSFPAHLHPARTFTLPLPTSELFYTVLPPPSAFTSLPLLTTPTAAASSVSSTPIVGSYFLSNSPVK